MTKPTSYFSILAALLAAALSFSSCEDEDNEELLGNWVETGVDFPGTRRGGAVCFVIDNVAYVGTGANTNKTEDKERYRDFYACRVENGQLSWSERWDRTGNGVASMPEAAPARNGAVGFSINGKGYVGTGYDGTNYLKDFWEYDPKANTWTQVADYPGDSCRYAVAFVIDNIAYVGTGEDYDDNILSDFYKFDGQKWTPIPAIGKPRAQASAFVYNGKGYVVGGVNSGTVDWFQCYNPATNSWEDLRRISDRTDEDFDDDYTLAAYGCTAFVLGDKAYLTTGGAGYAGKATWEYHIEHDYWVQKTSFEGYDRKFAVSFVLDMGDGRMVPYVTTGCSADITVTGSGGSFYSDTWFFNPYEEYEPKD